jgi:glucose dehydrogenase
MIHLVANRARVILARKFAVLGSLSLVFVLAACRESPPDLAVDDARLVNADIDQENWLTYGRTYKEQRHSPLTQINEETLDRLGLAWYADMATIRGLEATPLVVDGLIYGASCTRSMRRRASTSGPTTRR